MVSQLPQPPTNQDVHRRHPDHPAKRSTPWWANPATPSGTVRRHRARSIVATALGIAVSASATALLLHGVTTPDVRPTAGGGTQTRQTTNALLGQCGPTFRFTPAPSEIGTIPATRSNGSPNVQLYRTIVPLFGLFWRDNAPTRLPRFWAAGDKDIPGPEQLLGDMWNGWMVAYYTSKASATDIAELRDAARDPRLRMLVVPWPDRLGKMPVDRVFAFAVWAGEQTCQELYMPQLREFRAANPPSRAPGWDGEIPPVRAADPHPGPSTDGERPVR